MPKNQNTHVAWLHACKNDLYHSSEIIIVQEMCMVNKGLNQNKMMNQIKLPVYDEPINPKYHSMNKKPD